MRIFLKIFKQQITFVFFVFLCISNWSCANDSIAFYIRGSEYQRALNFANRMASGGANIQITKHKALCYKGLNRYEDAIPLYLKLIEQNQNDLESIIHLAGIFQSMGNFKDAQFWYNTLLELKPSHTVAKQQLAQTYFNSENTLEALDQYKKLYKNDSSFYNTRQIARCFAKLQVPDSAIIYFTKAIALNPSDQHSCYWLASILKKQEQFQEGISITNAYLLNDSTNVKILELNAFLHFLVEDYLNAVVQFENCLALGDSSEFIVKYLGYSYFRLNEYQVAKDYLESAFFYDTNNIDLCYALGIACDYSVYKKQGVEYLTRTIALSSPDTIFLSKVYQDLAHANTGHYKYDAALKAYMNAYEITPHDILLHYKIAVHYDRWLKNYDKALEYYISFMEFSPPGRVTLPETLQNGEFRVSYFDIAEKRIRKLKEEKFWLGVPEE